MVLNNRRGRKDITVGTINKRGISDGGEKKSEGRKDWWQQDKVDAVGWGVGFIWGALVLLAEIANYAANLSS